MIRRSFGVAIAILVLVLANTHIALAQLRSNEHLRLRTQDGVKVEGYLLRADSNAILVWHEPAGDTTITTRSLVVSIERAVGAHKNTGKAGPVGAVIGGIGGAIMGNAQRNRDRANGGLLLPNFPYNTAGALLGALLGGIVGGFVGYPDVTDWETLPLDAKFPSPSLPH